MALITCQDASFAYEGNVAVSGLNFAVHDGDYLCVVGKKGKRLNHYHGLPRYTKRGEIREPYPAFE
jgi:energy-coupling factor transporter ATP-binding protein EcfA2